jgi:hypothetical protein
VLSRLFDFEQLLRHRLHTGFCNQLRFGVVRYIGAVVSGLALLLFPSDLELSSSLPKNDAADLLSSDPFSITLSKLNGDVPGDFKLYDQPNPFQIQRTSLFLHPRLELVTGAGVALLRARSRH